MPPRLPAVRRTSLLICSLALLSTGAAHAQKTVPFAPAGLPPGALPASQSCSLKDKLPPDTIVIAAGSYSGRSAGFQIDQSGHEATQFDVAVHANKPVALLLGAYEPTVWNIGWSKGTRVVAVFATGYHRQAVAGLPKGTPIITSGGREKNGEAPCGVNYIASDSGLDWVNPKSRVVFGKDVTRVYTQHHRGAFDIVESTAQKTAYSTSPDTPPTSFRDKSAPLAGAAGLADGVNRGVLRVASTADVEMVQAAYREAADAEAKKLPAPDVPPVAGGVTARRLPSPSLHRAYVVLQPFTFPAGLYGGHSATFIVPKGVPAPTGNPGHSAVYDLNATSSKLLCRGPGCRY